ncbi:MAG: hypothetical protein ACR65U_04330 [Methylocystis sp.]
MNAALTVMMIFTMSTILVRIASTIMRLTGLPDNVARFQCLSAMTGTGFTTRESELIVNYPIRRRVLMTLMIIGNLGLVSIVSTFVVTFTSIGPETTPVFRQALWFLAAIALNFLIIVHPFVDGLLCRFLSGLLMRTTRLGKNGFVRLLSLEDHMTIAEHHLRLQKSVMIGDLIPEHIDLSVIMIRGEETKHPSQLGDEIIIEPFETAICFGKEEMHQRFADWLEQQDVLRKHGRTMRN